MPMINGIPNSNPLGKSVAKIEDQSFDPLHEVTCGKCKAAAIRMLIDIITPDRNITEPIIVFFIQSPWGFYTIVPYKL